MFVNNVVSTLLTQPPGNIKSILQSSIPSDVLADQTGTKFLNMITGLFNANIMYQKLGASIPPKPDLNWGDIAQKAAVSYLISQVVNAVTTDLALTTYNPVDEMFLLVTDQPNHITPGLSRSSDPLNPLPAPLQNIFDAAGAPRPA